MSCACRDWACGMGHHQWSSRKADQCFSENVQHVLDRLPEGDFKRTKDRNVPEMAVGRSGGRRAPSKNCRFIDDGARRLNVHGKTCAEHGRTAVSAAHIAFALHGVCYGMFRALD